VQFVLSRRQVSTGFDRCTSSSVEPQKIKSHEVRFGLRGEHRVGPGKWLAVNGLREPHSVLFVLLALLNNFKAYTLPFCDSVPEVSRLTVAT
jgi:hypothetical protein